MTIQVDFRLAGVALTVVTLLALPGSARAADTSTLDRLELYATMASVGVYAYFTGDDDGDADAWVEYRVQGAADWKRGHDLLPIAAGRLAGSVLFVEPATAHEVRVVLDDPDNAGPLELSDSVTTAADAPVAATGTDYWVDAQTGNDDAAGTQGEPLATISAAADLAQPGDTVHVLPGIYRETVTPPRGGTPDAPLWFVAEGADVIIDGSDAAIETATWTDESDGIYSAPFSGSSEYVAVDDERIYDYQSLADLQAEAAGLPGGFFVDAGSGRLYLRLSDGTDPSGRAVHVAVRNQGFLLDTISDVVVQGFELRYFGGDASGVAVDVRDSSRCWVRANDAHHMNAGFRMRRQMASENVIEDNTFRDTSVYGWPWDSVKSHTPEASAISITHGIGNVARRNVLEGSFNGIYTGAFGDSSEDIAKDTDIYENVMKEHGDDGLEPEGAQVNVRMWNNVIRGVKNAVSLAPIEVGPTFVVRNLIWDYQDHVLKLNNGSTGWILVYHNTGVPLPGAERPSAQAIEPSLPFGPFVSRNNIFEANRYAIEYGQTGLHNGVDLDHDDLWTNDTEGAGRFVKWLDVTYADIAALQASDTIEGSGFQVQPEYEDPQGGDFTLVEGHALVDAGIELLGINSDFIVGDGPDVGAFERGGVGPGPDNGTDTGTDTGDGSGTGGDDGDSNGTSSDDSGGSHGTSDSDSEGAGASSDNGCGCTTANGPAALSVFLIACAARRRRLALRA